MTIPWSTHTSPEVARVGLSEREAKEQGLPVDVFTQSLSGVDRVALDDEVEGFARVLVRKGAGRVVGATVVAAHAGEMIAEVTLAMTAKLGLGAVARAVHPCPSRVEALKKAGDASNRTRLHALPTRSATPADLLSRFPIEKTLPPRWPSACHSRECICREWDDLSPARPPRGDAALSCRAGAPAGPRNDPCREAPTRGGLLLRPERRAREISRSKRRGMARDLPF